MPRTSRSHFDPDDFRSLPVRLIAVAAGPVSAVTLVIALVTDTPGFVGWAAGGAAVAAFAVAQLALGRPDPALLSVFAATAVAVAAPLSSHDPIAAVGAGIVTMSLVTVSLYEPHPLRATGYLAWTAIMVGIAFWAHHPGWAVAVGLMVLFTILYSAWTVLRAGTRALERAERRYRTLFEHGGDALFAITADGPIGLLNAAACRTFGYEYGDLLGRPMNHLVPDDTIIARLTADATDELPRDPIETEGLRSNGDRFPAEITAHAIEITGDRYVMVTVRDITSRVETERLLHERDRVYRDLFDRIPVGMYRTSIDGVILDANPALAEMLGFDDPADLVGLSAGEFYPATDERSHIQQRLNDAAGRALTVEMQLRRRSGELIWVRDHVRVVTDAAGAVACYEGAMRDVTEERKAFSDLEYEIRSKTELIAAVSHEIRTPLTAVVGFIDVLTSSQNISENERAELLHVAGDQANDLALLVEDLLTSAQIEHDELSIAAATTSLRECASLAIDTLRPKDLGEIRNKVPEGLTGWCDPARVRQIVRNLVGNGLVHGAPPVTVSASRADGGMVEVVVADHGDGIPADLEERVFESFVRGRNSTTAGSIGLGLAVSRRLARLMGGDLTYRGAPGDSQFVLTVPGREPAESPPAATPAPATSSTGG